MGCFLACFGYSRKQKRGKPTNKLLLGSQRFGSYEPLESSLSIKLDITEKPKTSDSEFRDKPKERSSLRIRKKVTFNLNVTTYEPIPTYDVTETFLENDEEKNSGRSKEKTEMESSSLSLPEGGSVSSRMGSYPLNHRYSNCEDSYDEDGDIEYEEDDMDDEDDDEDYYDESDGEGDSGDLITRQEEFCEKFSSVPMESRKTSLDAFKDEERERLGLNKNARFRSQYVYSVLNPVENLTQWKEIKAKSKPMLKHQRKENIAIAPTPETPYSFKQNKPLLQETAVDASLSNWLVSSELVSSKEKSGKTDFKGF